MLYYVLRGVIVNVDWPCQWERANFDPLKNQHPSTDRQKIVTGDYVGDPTAMLNLVQIRPRGTSGQMGEI